MKAKVRKGVITAAVRRKFNVHQTRGKGSTVENSEPKYILAVLYLGPLKTAEIRIGV